MSWDEQARSRLNDRVSRLERYGKASVEPFENQYEVKLRNTSLGVYKYHRDAARLRNAINNVLKEYE